MTCDGSFDSGRTRSFIDGIWDDSILPALIDYIRIPNKSPQFDPNWQEHGYMDEAVALAEAWCRRVMPAETSVDVVRLADRTPVLFLDIPGTSTDTVLLYGHLDKQPEMDGWREGLGPWKPVIESDRLYGRGGADDGYALFASLAAILALRDQALAHPRCVILIECCEESGSFDLPHYVALLADRIGKPALVVCLDSGCGNYEQLWLTTSLRGLVGGDLSVQVLSQGVHSGDAGGIVPSSFRIARRLLSRVEDEADGRVVLPEAIVDIPVARVEEAGHAAEALGEAVYSKFPFIGSCKPAEARAAELILNRTWRAALEITGASGLPLAAEAGNVLRPATALRVCLRLPPTADPEVVGSALKTLIEKDPPDGAEVEFVAEQLSAGWNAPPLDARLASSVDAASRQFFGRPAIRMGEGGTIPFMGLLGKRFPEAQFVVTGVLGPHSNAHGPNEFLHLPTAKRVTCCLARVLHDLACG